MGASCDFRNHAAERAMRVILSDDGLCEDLPVVSDQRHRAVVARGFEARINAISASPCPKPRLCASAGPMTCRASPSAVADRRCAGAGAHGRGARWRRRMAGIAAVSRSSRSRPAATESRTGRWPRSGKALDQGAGYRPAGRRDALLGPFDEGCRKRAAGRAVDRGHVAPSRRARPVDRGGVDRRSAAWCEGRHQLAAADGAIEAVAARPGARVDPRQCRHAPAARPARSMRPCWRPPD